MDERRARVEAEVLGQFGQRQDKFTITSCPTLAKLVAERALGIRAEELDDDRLLEIVALAARIAAAPDPDAPATDSTSAASLSAARAYFYFDSGPNEDEFQQIRLAHLSKQVTLASQICRFSWAKWQYNRAIHRAAAKIAPSEKSGRVQKSAYAEAFSNAIWTVLNDFANQNARYSARSSGPVWSAFTSKLLAASRSYASDMAVPVGLHVVRSVEPDLREQVLNATHPWPRVVVGEAGSGKSTLLWSLQLSFEEGTGIMPLFLSTAWMLQQSAVDVVAELVASFEEIAAAGLRPILLLDTVDLMLHDDALRQELRRLATALQAAQFATVYSTRPQEAVHFTANDLRRHELTPYDDVELDAAVSGLVQQFCSQATIEEVVAQIRQASARGLPIADVCRSPLLLRMLFDLAAPDTPELSDVDVTRLFDAYWDRRVRRDARSETAATLRADPNEDLVLFAGAVGIGLLASGVPELPLHALETAVAATNVDRTPRAGIDALLDRGTLTMNGDLIGFFHQTMLEFTAAKGLLSTANPQVLHTLAERTITGDADLFVGAVLEQSLILSGDSPLLLEAAQHATARTIASSSQAIQGIGLMAWAHHPALLTDVRRALRTCGDAAVERACRALPGIAAKRVGQTISQLALVWQSTSSSIVQTAVLHALARLALRAPQDVAQALDYLDPLPVINGSPDDADIRGSFLAALEAISPVARNYVRVSLVGLLTAQSDGSQIGFDYLADQWSEIGDADLLAEIRRTLSTQTGAGLSLAPGFGKVIAAEWTSATMRRDGIRWNDLVHDVFNPDPSAPELIVAARLVALGLLLTNAEVGNESITIVVSALLSSTDPFVREVVGHLVLPELLRTASPASAVLMSKATRELATIGLTAQRGAVTTEQSTLLDVLAQSQLPDGLVAHLLPAHLGTRDWLAEPRLLRLAPIAADQGMQSAFRLLQQMAARPQEFASQQIEQIYATLAARRPTRTDVFEAMVNLALVTERTSELTKIVMGLDRFGDKVTGIAGLVLNHAITLLCGDPRQQRLGAALLGSFMEKTTLDMDWSEFRTLLDAIEAPEDRNPPLSALWAQVNLGGLGEQLDYLAEFVVVKPENALPVARALREPPLDISTAVTCAKAMLRLLTLRLDASTEHWPAIRTLALYDVESSDVFVPGERFAVVMEYIGQLGRVHPRDATSFLLDYLKQVSLGDFVGFNPILWNRELQTAVRIACASDFGPVIDTLIDICTVLDDELAAVITETIAERHYVQARTRLRELSQSEISPSLRNVLIDLIRSHDRRFGTRAFPEIVDIAKAGH